MKSLIARVCAKAPGGRVAYKFLQKRFGTLSDDPEQRLPILLNFLTWLRDADLSIVGSTFFEVGTGHVPIIPVCCSLIGAKRFLTVDLNRRMDLGCLKGLLNRLAADEASLRDRFRAFSSDDTLDERFEILRRYRNAPLDFLAHAGIEYRAPANAARTRLPAESIDYHFSVSVFEHIPPDTLVEIMAEARRILKDGGIAMHGIDLSDHFQHQDSSIWRFNFLRYSEAEWRKFAGNEFAYTNRLRRSGFLGVFADTGFEILRQERKVDPGGLPADFPLHPSFSHCSADDLCTHSMDVLLQK